MLLRRNASAPHVCLICVIVVVVIAVVVVVINDSDGGVMSNAASAPGEELSSIAWLVIATLSLSMMIDVAFERDALFLKQAPRDYPEAGRQIGCTGDFREMVSRANGLPK